MKKLNKVRKAGLLSVVSLSVLGAAFGLEGQSSSAVVVASPSALGAPQYEAAVPAGYDQPFQLAGDTAGPGVWFDSSSSDTTKLFHWNETTKTLQSWPLPSGRLTSSEPGGLAIGPNGHVLVGINSTIFDFDPTTQSFVSHSVPVGPDSSAAESVRPPELKGLHAIKSLSVASDGRVAIATSATTTVQLMNASGTFSQINLPESTEASSVGFASDGTLAVGLANYATQSNDHALISSPSGVLSQVAVTDSTSIATSNGQLVVGSVPSIVSTTSKTSLATSVAVTSSATSRLVPVTGGVQTLSNGSLVGAEQGGLLLMNSSGSLVAEAKLPGVSCSRLFLPAGVPAPSAGAMCAGSPTELATDSAGDVWFVDSLSSGGIGFVKAS